MRNVYPNQGVFIFRLCLVILLLCSCQIIPVLTTDLSEQGEKKEVYTLSDEKRLIKRLLRNYEDAGITGRPVKNTSEKVLVEMSLSLIQILDLDEKNQVLTTSVWVQYSWTDHILKWNPENYSEILEVRVPSKQIWTPDIVLYNYADERLKEMRDAMVIVQHTGSITWIPPAIYKSSCKIDIKNFPFDEQTCHMKFGSWTYDGNRLDVVFQNNESRILLSDYTESNEWEVIARPALRNVKYYPCCPEPYPDLTFFLFLRRNAAFFSYILVLPCVLLASLTLVIFWLPPESPAKMVLGMNIFVAFFLLLLLLADSTPQASNSVPYIGYYYCFNMILITLSSFLSVIVINLYFRGDRRNRVPCWIRKTCQVLSSLCRTETQCLEIPNEDTLNANVLESKVANLDGTTNHLRTVAKKSALVNPVNGPQTIIGTESGPKKVRKVKTRFASDLEDSVSEPFLIDNPTHTVQFRNPHYRLNQRHCETQTETHGGSSNEDQTAKANAQFHLKMTKFRSRSLTPSKFGEQDSAENMSNYIYPDHCYPHCTEPGCELCQGQSYDQSISADTRPIRTGSKHERNPENCLVCRQHLNALLSKSYEPTGHCSAKICPSTMEMRKLICSQARYEYRDGKPALVTKHERCCSEKLDSNDRYRSDCACKFGSHRSGCSVQSRLGFQPYQDPAVFLTISRSVEVEVQSIRQMIRLFLARIAKKDAENVIVKEWRTVAMVMDRIFFLCYLIIHLCAAFGLLIPRSSEYNVAEYLTDYRLKNYNATYSEEENAEIMTTPVMQQQPFIPTDEPTNFYPSFDTSKVGGKNTKNRVHAQTKDMDMHQARDYDPLDNGDRLVDRMSPYQRLVGQHAYNLQNPSDGLSSDTDELVLVQRRPQRTSANQPPD